MAGEAPGRDAFPDNAILLIAGFANHTVLRIGLSEDCV